MNRHQIPALLIVAFALSAMSGCVDPGPVTTTDLNHYQEELLRQSRQERARQGLALLDSLQSPSGPALQVEQDPKTKARVVHLSLRDAVWCALANNLEIRVVSYEPEISRLDVIRAEAVFDAVAFAELTYTNNDERFNSVFSRTAQSASRGARVGLRKHISTGADVSVSYALSREKTDSNSVRDSKYYETTATLEIVQPLLRDAWPKVNRATVRVAQINRRLSEEAFRQEVERTVTEVETTYWALVQAQREVAIQEGLLAKTIETRDLVKARGALDATNVQIAQTEAAVETRRATLIHAKKVVLDVQDSLAHLLADEKVGLLSGVAIIPKTEAGAQRVSLDVDDQLATAMENNPQLVQARMAITAAGEEIIVADNSLLPRLDLAASATYKGLADVERKAHDQVIDAKHDNYAVGLSLEYPLGNRSAEARVRRARVERLKAITAHRSAASVVARTVKERIRQIETTYQELSAQNARVKAATLQLSAIEATGELRQRSPEFLQLQISAQEALASALRSQSQSLIDYKVAQITLAQATGTVLKLYGVEMRQVSQPGSN